jgi:hypothetical protein
MKKRRASVFIATLMFLSLAVPFALRAQSDERGEGPINRAQPVGYTPEQIIQKFAAKEKQFKDALEQYTYRQDITVQTLDGDTVDGQYRLVYDITIDDKSRKHQLVVFAPQSTLVRIEISSEDLDDLQNRLPFVLTTDDLPQYNLLYVGQQREDELNCYVFDVAPKQIEKDKRYIQGRVWVDDHDLQIVKVTAKTVPDIRKKNSENIFPTYTTWRQQVDGKYWFPVYSLSEDTLHFTKCNLGNCDVRIREIVKYENYKHFGANVRITYQGQQLPQNKDTTPKDNPDNPPK